MKMLGEIMKGPPVRDAGDHHSGWQGGVSVRYVQFVDPCAVTLSDPECNEGGVEGPAVAGLCSGPAAPQAYQLLPCFLFSRNLKIMDVHFAPEIEKQLTDLAIRSGRGTDEVLEDALAGYLDEVGQTREMLDTRYDDLKGGKVKAIDGEEFFASLGRADQPLEREARASMSVEPGFVLHPLAAHDISEILDYIAGDNPSAARRVREEFLVRIRALIHFPTRATGVQISPPGPFDSFWCGISDRLCARRETNLGRRSDPWPSKPARDRRNSEKQRSDPRPELT